MEAVQAASYFGRVEPLLKSLEAALLVNQPEDPVKFLLEYLPTLVQPGSDETSVSVGSEAVTGPGLTEVSVEPPCPSTEIVESPHESGESMPQTGTVSSGPPKEEVEMDTQAIQDLSPQELAKLLIPECFQGDDGGSIVLPTSTGLLGDKFALMYSRSALAGWVRQDSPCCAGASMAGAWNALHGYGRHHPNAQDQHSGLGVLKSLVQRKIEASTGSFQRLLGAPVDDLIQAVTNRLEVEGRPMCNKGVSGKDACKLAVKMALEVTSDDSAVMDGTQFLVPSKEQSVEALENAVGAGDPPGSGEPTPHPKWTYGSPAFVCIRELLAADLASMTQQLQYTPSDGTAAPSAQQEGVSLIDFGDEGPLGDLDSDADVDEDAGPSPVPPDAAEAVALPVISKQSSRSGKGPKGKSAKAKEWRWRSALAEIFRQVGGLAKLNHPEKPNTAFIGNWGILAGVKAMNDEPEVLPPHLRSPPGVAVSISVFMGRGSKALIEVPLSPKDTLKLQIQQWNLLKGAFSKRRSALIFHLKNHYAIIYAMRDYEAPDGRRCKEMLTARRGQRPSAWISWEEARETMLRWAGHKIMLLELKGDSVPKAISGPESARDSEAQVPTDE